MRRLATLLALSSILCAPASAAAQDDALERAYKKEFTYLEAQKQALTERLEAVERDGDRDVRAARAEVDRLQGRVLSVSLRADELEGELLDAERAAGAAGDDADLLATTLEQARDTLSKLDVTLDEVADDAADPEATALRRVQRLDEAFSAVFTTLDARQRVRAAEGDFFDASGAKTSGTIVRVGAVAAYGVSADGATAGALAPAGDGRLKLWGQDAAASARALANGEAPETVGVFLYDSLEKNIEEKKEKTWREIVEAGGGVAWVIVYLGLAGLALVIIRLLTLSLAMFVGAGSVGRAAERVAAGDLDAALAAVDGARSPTGRVARAAVLGLMRPRDELEDVVAEALLAESPRLERFGSAIVVFAAVAPLLGLLGTVTGMISTFDIITEFGTGDPKMLSGGISEALITTQLGLIVAIPLILLGNMTNAMAMNVLTRLERGALHVINQASPGAPIAAPADATDGDPS